MRRLAAVILLPLLLLGCRAVSIDHRPDGTTHVYAASILTSPAVGEMKWQTPQTAVSVSGYQSKSEVTGADLANIAGLALKAFLAVP